MSSNFGDEQVERIRKIDRVIVYSLMRQQCFNRRRIGKQEQPQKHA